MNKRSGSARVQHVLILGALLSVLAVGSHAETISPRRLVEVADFSSPVVSPDGRSVAFRLEQGSVERNTYDSTWYVQSLEGRTPPLRVADGGVPLRDSAGISLPAVSIWSPDGQWIYYRALVDGKIAIWRAATDGSGARPVTSDPADVRDFSLSPDGGTLKYSTGATREEVIDAEQDEYYGGIHIDKTIPIGQNLYRSGYINGRLETQRIGDVWFDRVPLLGTLPDRWKAVDVATGNMRSLSAVEIPRSPATATDFPKALPEPWQVAVEPSRGRVALLTRVGDDTGLLDKPDVQLSAWIQPIDATVCRYRSAGVS